MSQNKKLCLLYINSICHALGKQKSLALPIFHSLTDCNTTSAFFGKRSIITWEAWNCYPSVTRAFTSSQFLQKDLDETYQE